MPDEGTTIDYRRPPERERVPSVYEQEAEQLRLALIAVLEKNWRPGYQVTIGPRDALGFVLKTSTDADGYMTLWVEPEPERAA